MIRTAVVVVWVVVATFILGMGVILFSFFSKTGNLPHNVASFWGRSILFVSGVRVTVKGARHLDEIQSCIFMSNHQSAFDIPILLAHLKAQFRWLAKAELFKIPFFGLALRRVRYISIDRSNLKSAIRSLKKAAETIQNGTSVMIFPEGTRSKDGSLLPFKKGGFVLAVDAGVPIVPIVITGAREIMPKGKLAIRSGRVTMEIMEPVDTKQYTRHTKEDLMDRIRTIIAEASQKAAGDSPPC